MARRRTESAEIAIILSLGRTGVPLVGTGALMLLGFGLWLVHLGRFGYGAGWVVAALALFVAAIVLGAIGGHRPKRARLHASGLAAAGAPPDARLRELLDDPLSRAINYASAISVLAILALMVFKP